MAKKSGSKKSGKKSAKKSTGRKSARKPAARKGKPSKAALKARSRRAARTRALNKARKVGAVRLPKGKRKKKIYAVGKRGKKHARRVGSVRSSKLEGRLLDLLAAEKRGKKPAKRSKKRKAPCTPYLAAKRTQARINAHAKSKGKKNRKADALAKKVDSLNTRIKKLRDEATANEKRRRSRKGKRKGKRHAAMAPRRGRKKNRGRGRRKGMHFVRAFNPIAGKGEVLAAIGGGALGIVSMVLGDRAFASHSIASGTDQPTGSQIYNQGAPNAAIWSNWKRIAWAVANLAVPGAGAMISKGGAAKSFWQLWFGGSAVIIGQKVFVDLLAKLGGSKLSIARLVAPEIDAQNMTAFAKGGGALPAYNPQAGGLGPTPPAGSGGGSMIGKAAPAAQRPPKGKQAGSCGCGAGCGCTDCRDKYGAGGGHGGMKGNPGGPPNPPAGHPGGGHKHVAPAPSSAPGLSPNNNVGAQDANPEDTAPEADAMNVNGPGQQGTASPDPTAFTYSPMGSVVGGKPTSDEYAIFRAEGHGDRIPE